MEPVVLDWGVRERIYLMIRRFPLPRTHHVIGRGVLLFLSPVQAKTVYI